ncbi:MAG: glycosyl transferase, group 2, partial [Phycisphaerales bacterium]|nr:glycosyl transferase, group 2 [Phycisphaerales bacterium]
MDTAIPTEPPTAPAVSVVIPTYNQPALLEQALASVRDQSFPDLEVIVIDDGSTDDTPARLAAVAAADRRVRVVRQPNAGTGRARNRGLDEARGRYVALLEHDDLWLPGKLAAQVAFLGAHPECVACLAPLAVSQDPGRPLFDTGLAASDGVIARPFRLAADKVPLFITCSALMFRRAAAAGVRFGEDRGAIEDVQFYIRLLARGRLGIAGGEGDAAVLAIYRQHDANASGQPGYYRAGRSLLRRLRRSGMYDGLGPADRADCEAWLAFVGRAAAATQLL